MGGARPPTVRRREHVDAGSGAQADPSRSGSEPPPGRDPLPTRFRDLPPLPPAFRSIVSDGLAGIDGDAPPVALLDALEAHARLLVAWNAAVNLTAIRDPETMATAHLLDSLAALPLLRAQRIDAFVDLGSGGGFPGLPLALALPAARALLVDSIGKKTRFLATVAEALVGEGLAAPGTIAVATARAEQLAADPAHRERWPAVLARAVAGLPELVELAFPLLRRGGLLVAWKRLPIADELHTARLLLPVLGGGAIEVRPVRIVGLEEHVLVVVEKRGATPARFPRPPAERKRGTVR